MTAIHTNPVPKPKHGTVVIDWSPRICGSTAWGGHLRAADPRIELISFSKSGRPLNTWESAFTWEARKISDAAALLNDYDKVILCDIACFAPDVTRDHNDRPYYEEVLRHVTRPWTAVFHGGTYPTKHDDTIDAVLSSPGFCGTLITPRIGQAKSRLSQWPALRFEHHPYLPYDPSGTVRRDHRKRTKDVIMTARLMSNKGQNAALSLANYLIGDTQIWGYNPFGFPSIAWSLWELGTMGLGYTQVEYPSLRRDKLSLTHPNAHHHYTGKFALQTPSGREFRYHDGYLKLTEIDWSPWVHLTLASPDFAGILEYTIIDAVFSGAIVAVPESFPTEGKYETVVTFPFDGSTIAWDNNKKRVRETRTFDRRVVSGVINDLLRKSNSALAEIANAQYDEFARLHDPAATLKACYRALKGAEKVKQQNITFTREARPADDPMRRIPAEPKRGRATPSAPTGGPVPISAPDPGERSGAFIRRCLMAGMNGDQIIPIVHANFPGSKAGPSDINWNKQKLKKDGILIPGSADAPMRRPEPPTYKMTAMEEGKTETRIVRAKFAGKEKETPPPWDDKPQDADVIAAIANLEKAVEQFGKSVRQFLAAAKKR